jgi:putative transcriptional regulator
MTIKTDTLFRLWTDKERRENRRITLSEVSKETGLAPDTIRKIRENQTSRFDAPVLAALCKYFDVEPGEPVPFLVYAPEDEE